MSAARLLRLLPSAVGGSASAIIRSPSKTTAPQSLALKFNNHGKNVDKINCNHNDKNTRIIQWRRQQVWRQLASKRPWSSAEDARLCRLVAECCGLESSAAATVEDATTMKKGKIFDWIFAEDGVGADRRQASTRGRTDRAVCPNRGVPWREVAWRMNEQNQEGDSSASIRASEVPQTVAIEDEPLDSVISETTRSV